MTPRAPRSAAATGNASIFITGGSRGLGLEIARLHVARGDRVALLARDAAGLLAAASALAAPPGRIAIYPADVRDEGALIAAMEASTREHGSPTRVYANAGAIERPDAPPGFDRGVFETNVYGVVNTVEAWLRTKPVAGAGMGIISSFSAFRGLPHLPAYGSSKAAITLYAESLRGRLRPLGITVTAAFLGYLDSELASSSKPSFLVTRCATAARVVTSAVDGGASRVAYPPLVRAAVFATRCLPDAVYDRLVGRRYKRASS